MLSKGNMKLLYVLIIIAVCNAQESTEIAKLRGKSQKLQENVETLMRQVGEMGMLIADYRRTILNGLTEVGDMCEFIDNLSDLDDKIQDEPLSAEEANIRLYQGFFQKLNDPVLKSQLFSLLENCFAGSPRIVSSKRDKSQAQKIRFHSWGGKRGSPKVVIRTPFHSWGGRAR